MISSYFTYLAVIKRPSSSNNSMNITDSCSNKRIVSAILDLFIFPIFPRCTCVHIARGIYAFAQQSFGLCPWNFHKSTIPRQKFYYSGHKVDHTNQYTISASDRYIGHSCNRKMIRENINLNSVTKKLFALTFYL